ncbi:MAG: hypothetical protein ACLVB2_07620 [Clostridium fessum]
MKRENIYFDRHSRRASGGDPISGICVEGYGGPSPVGSIGLNVSSSIHVV